MSFRVVVTKSPLVIASTTTTTKTTTMRRRMSSDWGSFSSMDDDDDINEDLVDNRDYANENDPQELKAQIGSTLEAPTIEYDAAPIFVPVGT